GDHTAPNGLDPGGTAELRTEHADFASGPGRALGPAGPASSTSAACSVSRASGVDDMGSVWGSHNGASTIDGNYSAVAQRFGTCGHTAHHPDKPARCGEYAGSARVPGRHASARRSAAAGSRKAWRAN
ncbi:MAG: hypothetical protein ABSG53_06420, partial [Thermoguttaceae bacterium]